jgi:hypothetical protein
VIEKFIAIFVVSLSKKVKVKAEAILCSLRAPVIIFGTHLVQNM